MNKFVLRIFALKSVDFGSLSDYGFEDDGKGGYRYSCLIADGKMRLEVTVDARGGVSTEVTDLDTEEPYTLFLVEEAVGGFVGSVRADYERVLSDIAEKCCYREVFKSAQAKTLLAYAKEKYRDTPEYLWEKFPDNAVLRRRDNRKWYAALLTVRKTKLGMQGEGSTEVVDLRGDPAFVAGNADGRKFYPGYHMNKTHWFTVPLDGSVPTDEILRLLDESYILALGTPRPKKS